MAPSKLLVVDDSQTNLDILCRQLQRAGYAVTPASSGAEALEALEHGEFSMMLLDLFMEGMDGIDVLQRVRLGLGLTELPILMISSSHDSPQIVQALDMGADDYLTKPVDVNVLTAKIRRYLQVRAPSARLRPVTPWKVKMSPGEKIAQYKLGAVLGQGTAGRVFQATDTRLQREVALKILLDSSMKPERLKRFVTEARAVARVSHPNVVTIFEIGEHPRPFIAMELVEGMCLDDDSIHLPVDPELAVGWTAAILAALEAVHAQKIVHRDLKPANIMVTTTNQIKVMDFGLAKIFEEGKSMTDSGHLLGTPEFMSPEHVDFNFGSVNSKSDLFAVAGILYLLLTGVPPFPAKNPVQQIYSIVTVEPRKLREINPAVPQRLADLCMRGLQKWQKDRFQSAREFSDALQAALPLA